MKISLPTLFGLVAAIGASITMVEGIPAWLKTSAGVATAVGVAGTGFFSRQHNVSDEDAGAKPKQ